MGFGAYNFDQIDKNMHLLALNSSKIYYFTKLKNALPICNNKSLNKN